MNKARLTLLSLALFGAAMIMAGASAKDAPDVLTMDPSDLLRLLPDAPKNWNITTSHARNEISQKPLSMRTYCTRDYLYVPPPDSTNSTMASSSKGPQTTTLQLADTGYSRNLTSLFDGFTPGETSVAGTQVRRYMMDNYPTINETDRDGTMVRTIFIGGRFILTVTLVNQPDGALDDWTKLANLDALNAAAHSAPQTTIPPDVVKISRVDELNPGKSGSFMLHY